MMERNEEAKDRTPSMHVSPVMTGPIVHDTTLCAQIYPRWVSGGRDFTNDVELFDDAS